MKKRIFSRVLALVMALSLLTTTVFAASLDDLQEAIDGTNDVEVTDDTTPVEDAKPADKMPEPSEPEAPEETPEPPTEPTTPTEPTEPADETHVNGALVRQEDGIDYFGYGWSSVLDEATQQTTWTYAIEAHDKDGNRFVVLLDNVDGSGEATGVVIGQDGAKSDVTIDMNDHNITGSGEGAVITVNKDATLNLNNGTVSGGEIGIDVLGNLFLDSVTVTNNGTGININDGGKATFKGDKNVVKDNDINLAGEGLVDFTLTVDDKEVTYKVDTKTAEKLLAAKDSIQDGGDNWKKTTDGIVLLTEVGNKKDILYKKTVDNVLKEAGSDKIVGFLIPEGVKTIDWKAFFGQQKLQTINIPSTVTAIGEYAFKGCTNWSSEIVIPDGLVSIAGEAFNGCQNIKGKLEFKALNSLRGSAFYNCKGLTGLSFSSTCTLTTIEGSAFYGCSGLDGKVTIPNSVKSIGGGAFKGCSSLDEIELPEGITTITGSSFNSCSELKKIHIPSTVTTIEPYAFSRCVQLSEIEIPDGLTTVAPYAFESCKSIKGDLEFKSLNSLGMYAFVGCKALTSISFSEGCTLTSIPVRAFSDCSALQKVSISNSVTNIEGWAFSGCSDLTTITIPTSVTTVGKFLIGSGVKSVWIPHEEGSETTAKLVASNTDVNIFVKADNENLSFYRGNVSADFGHYSADGDVSLEDGSVALTNVSGTITVNGSEATLPVGAIVSIDTDGNITVRAPITVDGTEYPNGATIAPDGTVEALPEPPVTEEPDTGIVITPDFSFDAAGTDSGTTIEDEAVPLAGLVTLAQLLDVLRQHEGIEDVELPEDFQWADHDHAQAIYWGLDEALVIDTEDEPLDPDEIVTVAILREVMTNYAAYLDTTFDVVIEGEDDMIVMNCDEILAEFYASLEDKAA